MVENNDLIGQQLGQFKVLRKLGAGGMAVVYEAHEMSLNRTVALKVIGGHLAADPGFVERFRREAQAAARLAHPGIIQIYSIGEDRGLHYFAMEYIKGKSVRDLIHEKGKLEPAQALEIVREVAEALAVAHFENVVHRDIKPANIMLTADGRAKVADFGIAHIATESKLTATGSFLGTPEYIAPEQCQGLPVDERADIYSLGVTLYEMLLGQLPFGAATPAALLISIARGQYRPLSEAAPETPKAISDLVERMMETDRDQRIQSAPALLAELDALGISKPGAAGVAAETVVMGTAPVATGNERTAVSPETVGAEADATAPTGPTVVLQPDEPTPRASAATDAPSQQSTRTDTPGPVAAEPVAAPVPVGSTAGSPRPAPSAPAAKPPSRRRGLALAFFSVVALAALSLLISQLFGTGSTEGAGSSALQQPAATAGDDEAQPQPVESRLTDAEATGRESARDKAPISAADGEIGARAEADKLATGEQERQPRASGAAVETAQRGVAVDVGQEPEEAAPANTEASNPQPASIPMAPDNSVTVVSQGEYEYVDMVTAWAEESFAAQQFDMIDAQSFAREDLGQVARYEVVATARTLSQDTLEYFGQSTVQFTVSLTMKVVALDSGRTLSGPRSQTVKYTHLNVEKNLRSAVFRMARDLARDLRAKI